MENKPTLLSQNIDAASYSPELDNTCKKLLSHRIILAMILCEVTKEFQGITPQEAVKYIDTPHISTDALDPDIPDVITGDDKESLSVMSKETRTFDINFTATVPNTENKIELIINIEAQGRNAVGYPILKRGIYYCSRLISDQYGKVFKNSEYEKIKKAYDTVVRTREFEINLYWDRTKYFWAFITTIYVTIILVYGISYSV